MSTLFAQSTDRNELKRHVSVLVVEPVLEQLMSLIPPLSSAGFHVTAAEGFTDAKPLLTAKYPSVLLTAARLGMYNGLHLVLRGKALQPGLAALVTSIHPDPVLQADVEAMGATFVVTPIATSHLVAAILQTLYRGDRAGPPIRAPFERRIGDRRSALTPFDANRRLNDRRQFTLLSPPDNSM